MSTSSYTLDPLTVSPTDHSVAKLLYIIQSSYSQEWHSTLHTHPCAELFFITDGEGYLNLADRTVPLSSNDIVIINSGVEHTEISSDSMPMEYIVLGIEGLEALAEDREQEGYSLFPFQEDHESILFCLRNLLQEIEIKRPGYTTVCRDLLEIILLQLMRRSEFTISFVPAPRKSSREAAVVRRYIENHFKENLSLDDLANIVHVSKYYLVHAFSKEYGVSPINYLLSCRISESCHLLAETDLTLSKIAGALGFSSPSYFSQSFRKFKGMSPMQYRLKHQNIEKIQGESVEEAMAEGSPAY